MDEPKQDAPIKAAKKPGGCAMVVVGLIGLAIVGGAISGAVDKNTPASAIGASVGASNMAETKYNANVKCAGLWDGDKRRRCLKAWGVE